MLTAQVTNPVAPVPRRRSEVWRMMTIDFPTVDALDIDYCCGDPNDEKETESF